MTYFQVDVDFPQHPKAMLLDDHAFSMHIRAMAWCKQQLTDGRVPEQVITVLTRHKRPAALIDQLVKAQLWDRTDGGWVIHDWLDWNASKADVLAKREADRDRMRRARSQNVRANTERSSPEVAGIRLPKENREQRTETEKNKNKDLSPAPQDDDRFEQFWDLYPSRNGKKLDKAKTQAAWSRMPHGLRLAALVGVAHYRHSADEGLTIPKDPLRWLQGKCWTDWQTPAEPTKALVAASGNGHRPSRNDVAFDTAAMRLGLDPAAANPFVGGDR